MIEEVKKLVDEKEYVKAVEILEKKLNSNNVSDDEYSFINNALGIINIQKEYENKSSFKAKRYFCECIKCPNPYSYAYIGYAQLEEDDNVAVNFLKEGIKKFPLTSELYYEILHRLKNHNEKLHYISKVKELNLYDYNLFCRIIDIFLEKDYKECEFFVKKLLQDEKQYKYDELKFKLILAISLIFQEDDEKLKEAQEILVSLIKEDIENVLSYAHYMFLIFVYLKQNNRAKLQNYFDKLPMNGLKDSDFPSVFIDFYDMYALLFQALNDYFKNDKERKIKAKALEAMYICQRNECYIVEKGKPTQKTLKALLNYYKNNSGDSAVINQIIGLQMEFEMFYDAFKIFLDDYKRKRSDEKFCIFNEILYEASSSDIIDINEVICAEIDNFYLSKEFLKNLIKPLINKLFSLEDANYDKYKEICALCAHLSDKDLNTADCLFKAAYSFSNNDNNDRAKRLYKLEIEKNPTSSGALNNLGVIYANEGNHKLSYEYYEKARAINPEEKLYIRNSANAKRSVENIKNKEFKEIAKRLNVKYFDSLGYDSCLIELFDKIADEKLKNILLDDLKECAIAIATKQHKSAIVLCGSIIEALLTQKISEKNIKKYVLNNDKTKKLESMALGELLYVAEKENIISNTTHHLAHFIKDYRNLIHPSCLMRKDFSINEEEVSVAWNILKKIINDTLS